MMVQHNQNANNPANKKYNNAYKFNNFGGKSGRAFGTNRTTRRVGRYDEKIKVVDLLFIWNCDVQEHTANELNPFLTE